MTVQLTPIDANTPQDALAKRLAVLLAEEGVRDTMALPLAIQILGGIQQAISTNDLGAAIDCWDYDRDCQDRWALKYHPSSKMAKAARTRLKAKQVQP